MNDQEFPGRTASQIVSRRKRVTTRSLTDRRIAIRFPLALGVSYHAQGPRDSRPEAGAGETVDFSSSGLRFTSERPLEPGAKVELAIDWPAVLDGGVQLQLTMSGMVVRSNGCDTALRIVGHGFKTRRRGLHPARTEADPR